MNFIEHQPWPWYVAGFLIGLIVPVLLIFGNKPFGISSTLRQICAACVPANIDFFKYDWKKDSWNLFFVTGSLLGGFIASHFLASNEPMIIAPATKEALENLGVKDFHSLLPSDVFGLKELLTVRGLLFTAGGGFLVGFGTRYAAGCTSGHSIFGLSTLQWTSLVATICFMAGGIFCTYLILPLLLKI